MTATQNELTEFREQASAWFAENRPADPGFLLPQTFMEVGDERQLEFLREWQHKADCRRDQLQPLSLGPRPLPPAL